MKRKADSIPRGPDGRFLKKVKTSRTLVPDDNASMRGGVTGAQVQGGRNYHDHSLKTIANEDGRSKVRPASSSRWQ